MTLPVFVSSGADIIVPTAGGTAQVAVPAGTQLNDLLLLGVLSDNTVTAQPVPAGFTLIDSAEAGQFSAGLYFYYRFASASEPATYPVIHAGSNTGRAKMYAYRGVAQAGTINVKAKSAVQNGTLAPTIPSVTTTAGDCLVIAASFEYNNRTPTISATGAQTSRGGPATAGQVFLITDEPAVSAGVVSGRTHASSASGDFFTFAIALAPSVAAVGDTTPPSLTNPTGTATGTTTASGSVSTNENTGTLFFRASTNATETAATVKASGSQAVTAAGPQNVTFTGLAAGTTYYAHYLHRDGAGNDSTVYPSATFTTTAADVTPPGLSSATATGGTITGTGGITSTEAGTSYWLVNTSSTALTIPASPGAMTGWTSRTMTANAQTFSLGALTAGSGYYLHQAAQDATGNRTTTDVVAGPFTVTASGDVTAPTFTGPLSIGAVTSSSIQVNWIAGSDATGITNYETSTDGTTWTPRGTGLSYTFAGLTASTSYTLRVRARDAAGNISTPVLTTTQSTSAVVTGTLTIPVVNNTNTPQASVSIPHVVVSRLADRTTMLSLIAQAVNGSGNLVISNAALIAGTEYMVSGWNADGTQAMIVKAVAS